MVALAWYGLGVALLLPYVRLVLLAVLAYRVWRWLSGRRRLALPPGGWLLAGAALAGAAVVATAPATRLALAAAWWWGLYLLAWWWLTSRPAPLRPVWFCLAALPVLVWPLVQFAIDGQPRPRGLFGNPNITAVVVAALLPCGLAWWKSRRASGAYSAGAALWLFLALASLTLAGSLGGWLAAAAGLAVYHGLGRGYRWPLSTWLALAAFLFLAGLTVWLRSAAGIHHSTVTRLEGWRVAWSLFIERPLTGHGPRSFGLAYLARTSLGPEYAALPHAHNGIAQIVAEGGALGLLAATAVCGVVITYLRQSRLVCRPVAAGGLAALAAGQVIDYTLWVPAVALLGLALAALVRPAESLARYRPRPQARGGWAYGLAAGLAAVLLGSGLAAARAEWPAYAAARAGLAGEWDRAATCYQQAAALDPGLHIYQAAAAAALAPDGPADTDRRGIERMTYRRLVVYP